MSQHSETGNFNKDANKMEGLMLEQEEGHIRSELKLKHQQLPNEDLMEKLDRIRKEYRGRCKDVDPNMSDDERVERVLSALPNLNARKRHSNTVIAQNFIKASRLVISISPEQRRRIRERSAAIRAEYQRNGVDAEEMAQLVRKEFHKLFELSE